MPSAGVKASGFATQLAKRSSPSAERVPGSAVNTARRRPRSAEMFHHLVLEFEIADDPVAEPRSRGGRGSSPGAGSRSDSTSASTSPIRNPARGGRRRALARAPEALGAWRPSGEVAAKGGRRARGPMASSRTGLSKVPPYPGTTAAMTRRIIARERIVGTGRKRKPSLVHEVTISVWRFSSASSRSHFSAEPYFDGN